MKKIAVVVIFSVIVVFLFVGIPYSHARGHGDDREGYEEDRIAGDDSRGMMDEYQAAYGDTKESASDAQYAAEDTEADYDAGDRGDSSRGAADR